MRHSLFEATMKEKDFTVASAMTQIRKIVRQNAEGLLACNLSSREAEQEIFKFLPQLKRFAKEYTEFGESNESNHPSKGTILENYGPVVVPTAFLAKSAEAIEEPVISPELGLKGNVDMLVRAMTTSSMISHNEQQPSIMGIELKTCHHQQAQNIHVAQLSLYVVMLQTRYGTKGSKINHESPSAADNGMLLYMNNEAVRAIHIAPIISETKSLIGLRNLVAIESVRSTRPRGVRLHFEESKDPSFVAAK
jgi:hypothetical protein